jgi:pimeloyl-ACP methyl ester carboxylesterase
MVGLSLRGVRIFRQFVWLEDGSIIMALSRPTHQPITHTVGWHLHHEKNAKLMKYQTVELNDVIIEYSLKGKSNRSIVFVNGFRIPLQNWDRLYPEIENFGKTLVYNRLGTGNSSKATSDQTGRIVVETLRALLKAINHSPPYILVGHSLGGIFINLYARLYPEEVGAIVFVDASHPDEPKKQSEFQKQTFWHTMNNGLKSVERVFDKYKYSEDEKIDETINQITNAGNFPQIPVAVVSGTQKMPFVPKRNFEIHLQCQKELVALTSNSKVYIAEQSGHFPQRTEPEIVLRAIQEIVESLRNV